MKLLDYIKTSRLYLDGAMGSELLAAGLDTRDAEKYNLTRPDAIRAVHRGYLQAGSRLIYTNTFGANAGKLAASGYTVEEVIRAAVKIAREEADAYGAYVAYDAGPTGELLEPYGSFSLADCYERYAEQARVVAALPVDCVVIETITDAAELRQAMLAFREHTDLPILASMSFSASGRTFTGCSVEAFVNIAESLGAACCGINCSLGAQDVERLVPALVRYARVPLFVKPNAGLPVYSGGKTVYDTDAEQFSEAMRRIAAGGISMLGGCCGTTPAYIRRTIEKTGDLPFTLFDHRVPAVCSAQRVTELARHLVIGERINPTGKPLFKQAVLREDYDYVASLAKEQAEDGADLLDLNAGMAGIDEAEVLSRFVLKVGAAVDLPFVIDSVKPKALERALRAFTGVAVINSVNAEQASLDAVLPLAARYGAYLVGLCLDENGIPEDAAGRVELAAKIVREAEKYGIGRERLFIDPLTMAVSVNDRNALVTLETMRLLREKLGVKTVIGLSNVSFGLPRRELVNAAFYDMCLRDGLSAAIVNPKLKPARDERAEAVLLGKDPGCAAYLAAHAGEAAPQKSERKLTVEDCVVKGLREQALGLIKKLAAPDTFAAVIDDEIIPALNKLGELYEKGKAFLPQLIAGAEAAKVMLDYIRETFLPENAAEGDAMVIATVKGDVHDIGKNIVKAVLSNYGYRIYDLGKDVPVETVVDAVKKYRPRYVGLSALMTTTLDNMERTVAAVKAEDPAVAVLVGGAVVTQEFADSIGADIYGRDAQDTVNKLKAWRERRR